jgi:type IV pilus assembly protein PilV
MNMPFSPAPTLRAAPRQGISMVELLVSLLIFSFGMLGLAGLQTRTLGFNQSSLYRSQATALTDDILERMRVDRANANDGDWNSAITVTSANVTGSDLYKVEMKDWKAAVERTLPAGAASVNVTTGVVTIILNWDDSRGLEAAQEWKTVTRL